jgi:hypothetical protein
MRGVDPPPEMGRHRRHGRDRRRASKWVRGIVRLTSADKELGESLPRKGARAFPQRGVQLPAPLETSLRLLVSSLQQQGLSQQAPGEGLCANGSELPRAIERLTGVVFDALPETVAVEVVLADPVMDVEDAGKRCVRVGQTSQPIDLLAHSSRPRATEVTHDSERFVGSRDIVGVSSFGQVDRLSSEPIRGDQVSSLPGDVRAKRRDPRRRTAIGGKERLGRIDMSFGTGRFVRADVGSRSAEMQGGQGARPRLASRDRRLERHRRTGEIPGAHSEIADPCPVSQR